MEMKKGLFWRAVTPLWILIIIGCSDNSLRENKSSDGGRGQADNIIQKQKVAKYEGPWLTPEERVSKEKVAEFIKKIGPYIKELRQSDRQDQAYIPIDMLFSVWNPIGRNFIEVKEFLGEPTRIYDGSRAMYDLTAPGEVDGLHYFFKLKNGKVVEVTPPPACD